MPGLFLPGFEVWRSTTTPDGKGGHTKAFAKQGDATGRLTPLSGGEQIRADQERGVISHRFSTSSATDIAKGDQLRTGSRVLTVDAVRITSSGRRKECVCEEDT